MENIETSLEEMKDVAIKYVNENIKEESLKTELVVNVEAALENWYLRGHREWLLQFTPVGIEPEFTIPLVDNVRPIGGYIDAVYFDSNNSTYFVVDHKTAKNFDRWRTGDGHRTQATMYSVALVLSPEFPDITELPEMVYMVSRTSKSNRGNFEATRVVRVQPTMEDVLLLGNRMRRAEEIVRTDAYTKNTDWPLCSAKWCPFFQGCQVDKTLDKEPALLRIEMRQQYNTPVSDIEGTGETQSIKSTTNNAEEVNK
jgi:hypothetical protein